MRNVSFTGREREFSRIREVDYRALRLLTERAVGGSELKRRQDLRKLDKAWGEGRLGYPREVSTEWRWRMCEARMMLGDYSDWDGWEYRSEWSAGAWHNTGRWRKLRVGWEEQEPAWQGQEVEDLLVFGEQGVGDEVCFYQALGKIRGRVGRIHLATDPRLVGVFSRAGVEAISSEYEEVDGERLRKEVRLPYPWIPLGDIPRNHYRRLSDFEREPYLEADSEQVERFCGYRGRVGISWRGAQGGYGLEEFAGLVGNPLGLQYDMGWDEEVEVPGLDLREDLEGLLGLLKNLERVVTVSTSVAHFAGALGVRCDVILAPLNGVRKNLLPFKWWCEPMRGRTPWYGDHVRVFRNLNEYRASL